MEYSKAPLTYLKSLSMLIFAIILTLCKNVYRNTSKFDTILTCLQRMGTWKITAHYEGDEENVVSREFKVQTFGKLLT